MRSLISAAAVFALASTATAQIVPFSQDFESLDIMDDQSLANDGWLVFGNVFDNNLVYQYGYGPFPAPMGTSAFSDIDTGQGGVDQGDQQLSVYPDYNNLDHGNLDWLLEANVYKEWFVAASDVGKTYNFSYQLKRGNLVAPSLAYTFIKLIDPATGYNLDDQVLVDVTSSPTTWGGATLSYTIQADQVGMIFQIGFLNVASNYESGGFFYDNVVLEEDLGPGVGINYCVASPNSVGGGAIIAGTGSDSVAANNLTITAGPVPNQPGIFFYGPNQIQLPFGNGFRCVGGQVVRLPVIVPNSGQYSYSIDNTTLPPTSQFTAGSTWNFQAWYRDPAGGGANFNLSDGLQVTFQP